MSSIQELPEINFTDKNLIEYFSGVKDEKKDVSFVLTDWIYPPNIKNWYGSIQKTYNGKYKVAIDNKHYGTYKTKDEAERVLKQKNIEFGFEPKNMYRMCLDKNGSYLEVKSTKNITFTIDYKHYKTTARM